VMFGAGNVDSAHRPDEFVPMDQVQQVAKALALFAAEWCATP